MSEQKSEELKILIDEVERLLDKMEECLDRMCKIREEFENSILTK